MSLAALALRLAAVEALCPTAALAADPIGPFPTVAGARVGDTYGRPIDRMGEAGRLPLISVFTEDANGRPRGDGDAASPYFETTTLVVEIEVNELDGSDTDMVPATSADAEALLDLMAAQVYRALAFGPTGVLFRQVRRQIVSIRRTPLRDPIDGIRFARKTLAIEVAHDGDDWSDVLAGTATLPQPLATVAAGLPAGSYGTGIIAALGPMVAPASSPEALEEIRIGLSIAALPASIAAAPIQASADTDADPGTGD